MHLTNEERRVGIYEDYQPICPDSVTPETPLEALNLNWTERDLPESLRTRHVHRLHPYLGKFIPQLAEVVLRKFFRAGQTVLDPFVGSGTTLVQANELGIHSVGCDISAFNVLLCRAKTDHYDLSQLKHEVHDALARARRATTSSEQLSLLEETTSLQGYPTPDSEYLREWYAPRALHELLAYREIIETGDYEYKNLLRVILSRSARSARLTPHYELDFPKAPQREAYYCYKHRRICEPTTEAFKFLEKYSIDTLRRIQEFAQVRTNARVEVYHADSRTLTLPSIDGVLTSPPYVGLIDYHEQHTYAYHLLGLQDLSHLEIGAARNGVSERARQDYVNDITQVFRNALSVMPTGGWLIVVANDKHGLYPQIAERLGVEPYAEIVRHVNRRTGRRSSEFFETVFVWRKP
ncbi:MAG: hypothetical protein KatS3mg020_0440 [Fimbriimonadales bacterium]|nr:MAG: hypothetical protein KatS3mg020_0440 [Fimbriimonadales bacterium]